MNIRRFEFIALFFVVLVLNIGVSLWLRGGNAFGTATASPAPQNVDAAAVTAFGRTFSYQGTLRDAAGVLLNGQYKIQLRLYNTPAGGTPLHDETFSSVVVRDGVFSVVVGDGGAPIGATVFDNAQLFLGITVNDAGEMVPRQRIHPVPWAMQASSAQTAVTANNLVEGGGVPNKVNFATGGANNIAFASGGAITDSGTGMTLSGGGGNAVQTAGAFTVGGDLTVAGNWSTTAVREVGDSKGGQPVRSDYPVSLRRYVVEAKDAGIGFSSVPIDDDLLVQLCGDEDGCTFRLGFRNTADTDSAVVLGGPFNWSLGQTRADGTRRSYVVNSTTNPGQNQMYIDKSPGTDHLKEFFDCYLTDNEFVNSADRGDTKLGYALLNANNSMTSINHVCVLIIED